MEIDKDGESFFLLLIMLITSIINDHVYLIVTFRLMQFDFKVRQFRFGPFTKLSDIYFQNKKLRTCNQCGESEGDTAIVRDVYICAKLHVCMSAPVYVGGGATHPCLTTNQFHDRAKLLCYAFHSLSRQAPRHYY